MKYSPKCASFLTMKSCQYICEVLGTEIEEKEKITVHQTKTGINEKIFLIITALL